MAINTETPISEVLYNNQSIPLSSSMGGATLYEHRITMSTDAGDVVVTSVISSSGDTFTFDGFCKYFYDNGFYRAKTKVMCSGSFKINGVHTSVVWADQFSETSFVITGVTLDGTDNLGPANPLTPIKSVTSDMFSTFSDTVISL